MQSPLPERWRVILPAALQDRFTGSPLEGPVLPFLTNHRGKLLSQADRGVPIHAAAFPRERRLVLEEELQEDAAELRRILVHELFHFVWLKLGNTRRHSYEALLLSEWDRRA